MKCINPWKLAALLCTLPALLCAEEGNQRTIVFNEDRNQHYMTTKVYELKNVRAHDLMPVCARSGQTIRQPVTSAERRLFQRGKQFLVVLHREYVSPWVDEMIATLDYPSPKVDESGARIEGGRHQPLGLCTGSSRQRNDVQGARTGVHLRGRGGGVFLRWPEQSVLFQEFQIPGGGVSLFAENARPSGPAA